MMLGLVLALLLSSEAVLGQSGLAVTSDGSGYATVSLNGLVWFEDLQGVSDVAIHKVNNRFQRGKIKT